MSSVSVTLTSQCDSHFVTWNISSNYSKPDGVAFGSNGLNYNVLKLGQLECENFCGFQQTENVVSNLQVRIINLPGMVPAL